MCTVEGCTRTRKVRLYCGTHYERLRTTGKLELDRGPTMCSHDGCDDKLLARALCARHYHQQRRGPRKPKIPISERLARRSALDGDCVVWLGARTKAGYGLFSIENRLTYVHRAAYETFVGPIGQGLTIDHLCRNTLCINPDHLEPVTLAENTRRELAARYAGKESHA